MSVISKLNDKIKNLTGKFGKKFNMVLAILLSLIVIIIFASSFKNSTIKTTQEEKQETISSFVEDTQERLTKILSSIKGAGNVQVFIMTKQSSRFIYASNKDEKEAGESSNKSSTTSSTIVFSKNGSTSQPIVELEIYPEITGVLVVAEGASDEKKRLMMINAVSVALDIENSKIEVLPAEKSK